MRISLTESEFESFLHDPKTRISIAYDTDMYFEKTWFGFKPAKSFKGTYAIQPELDNKKLRKITRKSKLRRGETFVVQPYSLGGSTQYTALRRWGASAGNLQGHDWTEEDVDFLLAQENVNAIVWSLPGKKGKDEWNVYYEAIQREDV